MKGRNSIQEEELDLVLNTLFLETCSREEREEEAHFVFSQQYKVAIDATKEAQLLARLNGKGGNRGKIFGILGLLLIFAVAIVWFLGEPNENVKLPDNLPVPKIQHDRFAGVQRNSGVTETPEHAPEIQPKVVPMITKVENPGGSGDPENNIPELPLYQPMVKNDSATPPAEVPYFTKTGLEHFAKVRQKLLQKLMKIDDFLYCKTEPGTTMYKSREVIISPFVMSNFPVTNLQYKTFLAALAEEERMTDLKKCLPKNEVWKEYGCPNLAKDYFENEAYNNFPVVNVSREACILYCEWLELEMNAQFMNQSKKTKTKEATKPKQVVVRLPYDYEWIYSADAAYTLIPDCGGYNTIYDPDEGLVDKNFFKRTSQVSKRDKKKENRMDQLNDVNRFGMSEAEMLAIFREAMNYKDAHNTGDPMSAEDYPSNTEACCLAGHVCELIKDKEGGMVVRGCCWKDKAEYQKMLEVYKKNDASPFVGFRVMILNTDKGSNRNPFWN